jgi:phosphatidylglycerophosphate synthase
VAVRTRELVLPANVLSLARIPLAAFFALAVAAGRPWWAMGALMTAGGTDVADGWCARRLHQETGTGRVVDPLADKIFFATAALALVLSRRLAACGALLLATRELVQLMLGTRLALERRLVKTSEETPSTVAGKMTTVLQAMAVGASLVWTEARAPLVVATAVCGTVAAAEYWAAARARVRAVGDE